MNTVTTKINGYYDDKKLIELEKQQKVIIHYYKTIKSQVLLLIFTGGVWASSFLLLFGKTALYSSIFILIQFLIISFVKWLDGRAIQGLMYELNLRDIKEERIKTGRRPN